MRNFPSESFSHGEPPATALRGRQIDGHHLSITCSVLGAQVVMSPVFMGLRPTSAASATYSGTTVLQAE
ncbi:MULTISPECIES: DUF3500 domain-containing protein [Rhizobiaceae]|uniref:DUF3500 domain-containing protein n=1 Tax=Rhizobiaceae TaxID=82115 RepID=UPI0033902E7D